MELKDWISVLAGLVGVIIGAILVPYFNLRMEKLRYRKQLKSELMKSVFSYYLLLKEKSEIVNTLSMDEWGATHIGKEIKAQPPNKDELEKVHTTLLDKIARKNAQHDPVVHRLVDIESAIHSTMSEISISYDKVDVYNTYVDILKPYFNRKNIAVYLYDYINFTKDQYNNLSGNNLQKELIAFGKGLDKERDQMINGLVKYDA